MVILFKKVCVIKFKNEEKKLLWKNGGFMYKKESGQGLTEYAVVLSLVAVASIAGMALFGGAIKGKIASLSGAIAGQSESEVSASDKKSKNAAKEAAKRASNVRGNTTIDKENIFDSQGL
jgi:Flp pilus assembly pilin Flp